MPDRESHLSSQEVVSAQEEALDDAYCEALYAAYLSGKDADDNEVIDFDTLLVQLGVSVLRTPHYKQVDI